MTVDPVYLLKNRSGETRETTLAAIRREVEEKTLGLDHWVRTPQQDFWYGIDELLGRKPPREVRLQCPFCKRRVAFRVIDTGLAVPCPACRAGVVVPDVEAMAARQKKRKRSQELLAQMRRSLLIGLASTAATVVTYMGAVLSPRGGFFWVFPLGIAYGCGNFFGQFWQWRRLQSELTERPEQPVEPVPPGTRP